MEVRGASLDDADQLAALLAELGYPATGAAIRRRLEHFRGSDRDMVVIAESDAGLLGMLSASVTPLVAADEPLARITALVVKQTFRTAGVGRQLVSEAEQWAISAGCSLIQVTSGRRAERAAAHRFYPRLGYRDAGDDEVLYEKRLAVQARLRT